MTQTKRIGHLDILKFFAIASVVLGHTVEQTTGNDFWTNPIWGFIYSYHMPLFMLVCGYFFGSSLKRSFGAMLSAKSRQLLIPTVFLSALIYGVDYMTGINPFPEMFAADFTSVMNVLWFLKCVLLCYIIAYISMKLSGNTAVAAISTSILFTLLPGGDFVNLNFLLPLFWIGYALNRGKDWCAHNKKLLLYLPLFSFAVMLLFWSGQLTVYAVPIAIVDWNTMSINLPNLAVTVYRLAIGVAGSLTFFMLAPMVSRKICGNGFYATLLNVGKATLGIYVVQTFVIECGLHIARIYLSTAQTLAVTPLLAACGLAACYLCVLALRTSNVTRLLVLGEKPVPSPRLDLQP